MVGDLLKNVPLAEHVDRLAENRAMRSGLDRVGDAEAVLEADDRAVVEAEELLGELAEVRTAEIANEPVREAEVAVMPLQWQRRRQVHDGLVDLDFLGGRGRVRRLL